MRGERDEALAGTVGAHVLIGVDLDNTIVCYDELFHRLAVERDLVPAATPARKTAVRDALRAAGCEEVWTELQAEAYGPRMAEAVAFEGVGRFFDACRDRRVDVVIVSHRTRRPYRGPAYDLHAAALGWLEREALLPGDGAALAHQRVFLEPSKEAKAERVAALGCTHFIDDLPEFLASDVLPRGLVRVLFDVADEAGGEVERSSGAPYVLARSWAQLGELLLGARSDR